MTLRRDGNEDLFAVVRAWVARYYPGRVARRLRLTLDGGEEVRLPVPPPCGPPRDEQDRQREK